MSWVLFVLQLIALAGVVANFFLALHVADAVERLIASRGEAEQAHGDVPRVPRRAAWPVAPGRRR